jgi:DNA-nicking Smr family endonuclease
MSIDLHSLTVAEAKTVALETASAWYAAERAREPGRGPTATFNPSRPLTVVTGVGRHSPGQVGVLGPSVANALEAAGWKVDRGHGGQGYLIVRGKR